MVVIDAGAHLSSANHAAEALLGYATDSLLGRCVLDLVHPDDIETAQTAFADLLAGTRGPDDALVLRVRNCDGSRWLYLETNAQDLVDHPASEGSSSTPAT